MLTYVSFQTQARELAFCRYNTCLCDVRQDFGYACKKYRLAGEESHCARRFESGFGLTRRVGLYSSIFMEMPRWGACQPVLSVKIIMKW